MSNPIDHEVSHHNYLRDRVRADFPDVDEETLADTIEGMTKLSDMLAVLARSRQSDLDMIVALRIRLADLQIRMSRLGTRVEAKRDLIVEVMERADIKKVTEPDFTLSLKWLPAPLVVVDEGEIPERFWNPQPAKLDRRGLIDALKADQTVNGATLGNGGVTISIRTR